MVAKFRTIVDLLDAFFGSTWTAASIDNLSNFDLDALAGDVDDFYREFEVPEDSPHMLRTYSGGATFPANIGGSVNPGEAQALSRIQLLPFAHSSALYVDEIVVNCPLDSRIFNFRDFAVPRPFRSKDGQMEIQSMSPAMPYGDGYEKSPIEESRESIKAALSDLSTLAPAIRQGWIIPVPHLRIWKSKTESVRAQLRRDVMNLDLLEVLESDFENPPAMNDLVRGARVVPGSGVVPQDYAFSVVEPPMIYFNYGLAVVAETRSRFLPVTDSDLRLLYQRVDQAGRLNRQVRDAVAVGSLRRNLLPLLEEASFDTICNIRNSEASFNAWRTEIRRLADGDVLVKPEDMQEYESILDEKIREHIAKIEHDIEKSRSLKNMMAAVKPTKLDVALAGVAWAVPPHASPLKLIAAVAAPVLKAALTSLVGARNLPSSVIVELRRASK
ncbi:hypothetical protein [Amycolatopsis circi]|uniref:hypothetical protein n=1 Tax=Amycolatopsis circi TaxID=871959 RepID=UPI0013BE9450|nr:hypothetical protein [Amycolatopsis circi]